MFTLIWLVKALLGDIGRKDRQRIAYGFGLWSPEMRPHWARLRRDRNGHSLINVGTEYNRLDPQRAFKLGLDFLLLVVVVMFLLFR